VRCRSQQFAEPTWRLNATPMRNTSVELCNACKFGVWYSDEAHEHSCWRAGILIKRQGPPVEISGRSSMSPDNDNYRGRT